jgi:hypothetical protein
MGMPNFLQIPGSVPWWLLLIAIIPLGLYVLMLLAMPFSVFGVKSRLEAIEAKLDDMHADIRSVALLHAAGGARTANSDDDGIDTSPPPIAPSRAFGLHDTRPPAAADAGAARRSAPAPGGRAEPRLNWPK